MKPFRVALRGAVISPCEQPELSDARPPRRGSQSAHVSENICQSGGGYEIENDWIGSPDVCACLPHHNEPGAYDSYHGYQWDRSTTIFGNRIIFSVAG